MAASLGEAVLELSTDSSKAESGLSSFQAKLLTLDSAINLAALAWGAFTGATGAVVGVVQDFVGEASASEFAIGKLNAALNASHSFSTSWSKDFQDLASGFQDVSTQSDETVTSVERLFVSFGATSIGQVEKMTQGALDLAAGLGIDLNTAAMLLGKTMQGQGGILKRYGIDIDETAKASVQLEQALHQVQERFGGQAAAEAKTFTGSVARARNALSDFKEEIGKAIIDSPLLRDMLDGLIAGFKSLSTWAAEHKDSLKASFEKILGGAATAVDALLGKMASIAAGFDLPAIETAINTVRTYFQKLTGISVGKIDTAAILTSLTDFKEKLLTVLADAGTAAGTAAGSAVVKAITSTVGNADFQQMVIDLSLAFGGVIADVEQSVYEAAKEIGTSIVNGIVAGIKAGAAAIAAVIKAVMTGGGPGGPAPTPGPSPTGGGPGGGINFNPGGAPPGTGNNNFIGLPTADQLKAPIQEFLDFARTEDLTVDIPVEAFGSPNLPFTEYFLNYAPAVFTEFGYRITGLTAKFSTGFSAAMEVMKLGAGATMEQIDAAAAQLQSLTDRFGSARKQLEPFMFGNYEALGMDRGKVQQENQRAEEQAAGMLTELQRLRAVVSQQAQWAERSATATEKAGAATASLASSFSSGRFYSSVATGISEYGAVTGWGQTPR